MLTYKSHYNIAPTYLCELISRKESSVNTWLGADHHQLFMPPISTWEWNKLSEYNIRTSNFDSSSKMVVVDSLTNIFSLTISIF